MQRQVGDSGSLHPYSAFALFRQIVPQKNAHRRCSDSPDWLPPLE
jgi:hypothetical protein